MYTEEEQEYLEASKLYRRKLKEANERVFRKYGERLSELKEKLSSNCRHAIYTTHTQNTDNGYGKWWKADVHTCLICGEVGTYVTWPLKTNKGD